MQDATFSRLQGRPKSHIFAKSPSSWDDQIRAQVKKFNKAIENGVIQFQDATESAVDSMVDNMKEGVESFDPIGQKVTDRMAMKARNLALEPDADASEVEKEIEELRFFKEKMTAFMIKEQEKAAQEDEEEARMRSYLPDPDLMRVCLQASGASFETCMDALRDSLMKTSDEEAALLMATALASGVDPKALEFVVEKGGATLVEAVRAIREEGGVDGDDTLAAIEKVMVNRRVALEERASKVVSGEGGARNGSKKAIAKSEWSEMDKVACFSTGDWWEGTVLRVIPRRTGTMYEVEFSDKTKQVVGGDCVKARMETE